MRILSLVFIVVGVVILIYGSFSYTKDTTAAKIGSLELNVKEKKTVNIPVWAGVGAIVLGGIMFLLDAKQK